MNGALFGAESEFARRYTTEALRLVLSDRSKVIQGGISTNIYTAHGRVPSSRAHLDEAIAPICRRKSKNIAYNKTVRPVIVETETFGCLHIV